LPGTRIGAVVAPIMGKRAWEALSVLFLNPPKINFLFDSTLLTRVWKFFR